MKSTEEIQEQLLSAYITGQATEAEKKLVEEWIDSSPGNAMILQQAWFVWQCGDKLRVMNTADPDPALRRFKARLRGWRRRASLRKLAVAAQRIAAILIIPVFAFAIHFWRLNNVETNQWAEVRSSPGMVTKFDLPDGSVVWLNSGGSIRYPLQFKRGRREVELQGQGYFSVRHNKNAPFFVRVDDKYAVEVLGTELNITAYEDDNLIETTLVNGSVRLNIHKRNGQLVYRTLRPNQKAIFNRSNNSLEVTSVDPEYDIAWKEGRILFKNRPMEQVLKVLSRYYNVSFDVKNPRILEGQITAKFTSEPLAQVLEYLSLASGTKFTTRSPNRIDGDSLKISVIEVTKHN